jgi:pimeloyl-ACP methyl ester carboxylesterase
LWSEQISFFSTNFRTIAYDIRGFGESELVTENLSLDLFAEDLNQLIDALSLEKVVLCGFSMGGYIALNAMQKFPEKIIGLVLADTQCQADTEEAREKRMKSCENIRRGSLSLYADEMLTALVKKSEDGEDSKDMIALREVIEHTSKDTLCSALVAMANRDASCHVLKDITVPTLILVGEEDSITPPEKSEIMNSEISGATLHVIPYAKHLSNIDNPADFNRHLSDLLNSVQKQRSHLPEGSELK